MSARKFPHDLSRAGQQAVRAALELAVGAEVPGGMRALKVALGTHRRSVERAVTAAEAFGLLLRKGSTTRCRLFVVDLAVFPPQVACTFCGEPASPRAEPCCRHCQVHWRSDRRWRMRALELLVIGAKSIPEIAVAVSQDVFPRPGEPLHGVLAYLLGEIPELVPAEWAAAYHARVGPELQGDDSRPTTGTRKGGPSTRSHERLTAKHRVRRARAKAP